MRKAIVALCLFAVGAGVYLFHSVSLSHSFWLWIYPKYIEKIDGIEISELDEASKLDFFLAESPEAFIEIYESSGFENLNGPSLPRCKKVTSHGDTLSCHKILSQYLNKKTKGVGSRLVTNMRYVDFCKKSKTVLPSLEDYFIRLVPADEKLKGTALLIHGRASSPESMIGICGVDYTKAMASFWLHAGYQVIIPKVTAKIGESEERRYRDQSFIRDLIHLNYLSSKIGEQFASGAPTFIYGISYGDALASVISYSQADVFSHYISSGGIWRTDKPFVSDSDISNVSFFYYADAFLFGSHIKTTIVSSSYDWGRISSETKARLIEKFRKRNLDVRIFPGLHEANPKLQIELTRK